MCFPAETYLEAPLDQPTVVDSVVQDLTEERGYVAARVDAIMARLDSARDYLTAQAVDYLHGYVDGYLDALAAT